MRAGGCLYERQRWERERGGGVVSLVDRPRGRIAAEPARNRVSGHAAARPSQATGARPCNFPTLVPFALMLPSKNGQITAAQGCGKRRVWTRGGMCRDQREVAGPGASGGQFPGSGLQGSRRISKTGLGLRHFAWLSEDGRGSNRRGETRRADNGELPVGVVCRENRRSSSSWETRVSDGREAQPK